MAADQQMNVPSENDGGVDISPEKDGGVLKKILKDGEGDECPCVGSEVFVHYTGTLLNGEKFDSSRDRDDLFSFKLGEGSVIKGWDVGVATMKKGEVCVLTCAPDYAYGSAGSPPKIPANATLRFEVELFYWKDEDITGDGGVIKKVLLKGEGFKMPKDEACVTTHIRGMYKDTAFEERDVEFVLGEGEEKGICLGIEKALYKMKKREKVHLRIQANYGFGEKGSEEYNIPGNAEISYEVYLTAFENPKETYEMELEEKMEVSQKVKDKGTSFFKSGNYERALTQYNKMIKLLDVYKDDEKLVANPLKCIGHLNAAMCELKMKQYQAAKKNCDKALEIEDQNVKGFFRRGQANFGIGEFELARKDFKTALEIDPKNKAAHDQLKAVINKIKEQDAKERKKYGNMFERFAREDQRRTAAEKKSKPTETDVFKQAAEEARKAEEEMDTDEQKKQDDMENGVEGVTHA
ncbi:peptidyl-prolyl cis-trans isomerase FKBP4-like [Rhopilema esculentum]|uniref:peptidyl-prolyl cis-trans isomerase FKBP4-like n=1 Tax=Rhopilema esculentum TaxID=499914 RepID=UPI0031D91849